MTAKTETIIVPLNKLDRDPKNVRKTYSRKGIEEMAANIRADGYRLLQDPIVRKGEKRATRIMLDRAQIPFPKTTLTSRRPPRAQIVLNKSDGQSLY